MKMLSIREHFFCYQTQSLAALRQIQTSSFIGTDSHFKANLYSYKPRIELVKCPSEIKE